MSTIVQPNLTAAQKRVYKRLLALRDIAPAKDLRGATRLSTPAIVAVLRVLEQYGLVVRYFNAHGPQEPWWWRAVRIPPEDDASKRLYTRSGELVLPEKGQIYDYGRREDRVWLEVKGPPNQYGAVPVSVRAGEHNHVSCYLPLHFFHTVCYLRRRGEVTPWSAGFHCPVHGECTEDMVKTDKTCTLCGSMLNRVG